MLRGNRLVNPRKIPILPTEHYLTMSTTFTWAVTDLERETADGYVYTAHYTVTASDDSYSSGAYGSVGLERPDTLIPYDNLLEEQVIGWVKTALGGDQSVTEIQEELQNALNEKASPTKARGLPWR